MSVRAERAGALLVLLVGAAVSWLRLDPVTRGTLWAEDGLFLGQRLAGGPVSTLFDPYAGYLHLAPRVLIDLAVLAPLDDVATTISVLCCLVVGAVAMLVFVCTRDVLASPWARLALAAITVLVPPAPIEVLGNVANLHWYLFWLAPWLLLARPSRRPGRALGAVALVVGLTEIQVAVFVPLVLLARREPHRRPVAAGLLVGVLGQVAVTISTPRPVPSGASPGLLDVVEGYLLNVVLPLWSPSVDGAGRAFAEHGWALAVLAVVPFVLAGLALAGAALRDVRRGEGLAPLLLVAVVAVGAIAPLVAGLVLNFQASYAYTGQTPAELANARPLRYGVVSAMFLLAIVVVLADRALAQAPGAPGAWSSWGSGCSSRRWCSVWSTSTSTAPAAARVRNGPRVCATPDWRAAPRPPRRR